MKNLPYFLLATLILSLSSCKKDTDDDLDTASSEDQAFAQSMFDDLGSQSESSSESAESEDSTYTSCATITVDTLGSPWPFEITVDFGEENCTGQDGRERRGKLVYTITDWFRNVGSTITLTPVDYYVDDNLVEGTRTSSNLGENSSGQLHYEVKVEDGKVTNPDGETILWESTRTRTWVEGQETGFFTSDGNGGWLGWDGITDDVYEITGNGSGTSRAGLDFDLNITNPLRVQLDCKWITEGTIILTPAGFNDRSIDYGTGECDNKATVTINDNETEIKLRG
ncbi:hypothetical protein N8004_01175 [Salibacteraceae bacterium]|jgi:hypothetical protein|nr:hypothetical protein [Salibacteraceae bacterium]